MVGISRIRGLQWPDVSCGSWVANSYTYYGRWVSCTALGHGVYRTKGTGVVEPDEGLAETANGYSTSTTLC